MVWRDKGEDYRWNFDRLVTTKDLNPMNDVGIFHGPVFSIYPVISRTELEALIEKSVRLALIDMRDKSEYEKGHICGAVNIPVARLEEEILRLIGREDLVIVYGRDERCAASAVAMDKLSTLAYKRFLRFKSGYRDWKRASLCTEGAGPVEAGTEIKRAA